jgi:glycosylphosphatidylinositol transamidase
VILVYRLNTYPVIHMGFFHAFFNAMAVTPLLERFEAEHGTLTAIALFVGRECSGKMQLLWPFGLMLNNLALSTFPAGLYILFERFILHRNTSVVGARYASGHQVECFSN